MMIVYFRCNSLIIAVIMYVLIMASNGSQITRSSRECIDVMQLPCSIKDQRYISADCSNTATNGSFGSVVVARSLSDFKLYSIKFATYEAAIENPEPASEIRTTLIMHQQMTNKGYQTTIKIYDADEKYFDSSMNIVMVLQYHPLP
eukprot:232706_1